MDKSGKKVDALKLGPDMTKVAIYVQEGGDLRTNIVTSWAPVGAKKWRSLKWCKYKIK